MFNTKHTFCSSNTLRYFLTFVADGEAFRLDIREAEADCGLRTFSPLPREGVFLWEPDGVVEGGGTSGSVVRVGLSARRLEAVLTPPPVSRTHSSLCLAFHAFSLHDLLQ